MATGGWIKMLQYLSFVFKIERLMEGTQLNARNYLRRLYHDQF
jgi:hypothetical protein